MSAVRFIIKDMAFAMEGKRISLTGFATTPHFYLSLPIQ